MADTRKTPRDYDQHRENYYIGDVLISRVQKDADKLGWSPSKLLRVTLYQQFGMMQELAEELAEK